MTELINEYKVVAGKLRKLQRVVFKKHDAREISNEFQSLATKLESSHPQYSSLCYLGAAKCDENSENYMKASRMMLKAVATKDRLGFQHNDELIDHRSYCQAIAAVDDAVMKTCIIREMREINNNLMVTSNFTSSIHRIYDLEKSANKNIESNDFILALEKLTELTDDITERKEVNSYTDVMKRNEISRLFLLLLLDIPPSRHSPSNLKLLEKYTWNNESLEIEMASLNKIRNNHLLDENAILLLEGLVNACQNFHDEGVFELCDEIKERKFITAEQHYLLEKLTEKFKLSHSGGL